MKDFRMSKDWDLAQSHGTERDKSQGLRKIQNSIENHMNIRNDREERAPRR